jgi:cephalosporin-C deacetylase-like acetyl esterase
MYSRRCLFALLPAATLIACATAHRPQTSSISVIPLKSSGIYAEGEDTGWTISASTPSTTTKFSYSLKENNAVELKSGNLDLSAGPAKIEIKLDHAAMLFLQITPEGSKRGMAYGAAIAPTKLRPVVERPRDFDAFWKSKIAMLEAIPENPVLTPGQSDRPDVDYGTVQMDHINGAHVYGQWAKPTKPGKYPAVLMLQWASPPYPLQKPWVTNLAAQGWLALDIEPHNVLPTEPQSYYDGLPKELRSYQSIGQDDRDKSYFLQMYLADYRAVDYLTHRPDWDGKTLLVMGTSMGGQQTFAVCGLHPKVTHLIVEVPAGCDLNAGLHGRQEGYPFFPTNDPKVMETARYFDAVNFAPHIHATSLVSMGFVDTVAPPTGIWTVYNLIKGKKEVAPMVDAPHNNLATREQQLPYTTRMEAWMNALVKGEKAPVLPNQGLP